MPGLKLMSSSALLLVSQVSSRNFDSIVSSITDELQKQTAGHTVGLRNFKDSNYQTQQIEMLNNYGCWCYFYDNHGPGRGEPQDEIDRACKALHHGYECMIIDGQEEGESCGQPWDVSYERVIPTGKTFEEVMEECRTNNNGKCEQRACMIETKFIQEISDLYWWREIEPKPELHHSNGFDPNVSCIPPQGLPPSPVNCCGDYPSRFAYKTLNGDRGCCNGRTYMTLFNQCCEGEVKDQC